MRDMQTCPVCGDDCNEYFIGLYNEIIGCDRCVTTVDAYERAEEDRIGYLQDKAYDEYKERSWGLR